MLRKVRILKWLKDKPEEIEDLVCVEETFEIYAISEEKVWITSLIASPSQLRELGAGFLVGEGYVKPQNIISSEVKDNSILVTIRGNLLREPGFIPQRTDCGIMRGLLTGEELHDSLRITPEMIAQLMEKSLSLAENWRKTGGMHWAGLFDADGKKVAFAEDIGRHNAVDKVIGKAILNGIDLRDCILVSSGRMPSPMVKKVVNARIPVIVTKSPPTDKGVTLAREFGITLVGFARGKRFNVYSGGYRLTI